MTVVNPFLRTIGAMAITAVTNLGCAPSSASPSNPLRSDNVRVTKLEGGATRSEVVYPGDPTYPVRQYHVVHYRPELIDGFAGTDYHTLSGVTLYNFLVYQDMKNHIRIKQGHEGADVHLYHEGYPFPGTDLAKIRQIAQEAFPQGVEDGANGKQLLLLSQLGAGLLYAGLHDEVRLHPLVNRKDFETYGAGWRRYQEMIKVAQSDIWQNPACQSGPASQCEEMIREREHEVAAFWQQISDPMEQAAAREMWSLISQHPNAIHIIYSGAKHLYCDNFRRQGHRPHYVSVWFDHPIFQQKMQLDLTEIIPRQCD